MLVGFVRGSRSDRRLTEKQAVFVRAFVGGLAVMGLFVALDHLRFLVAPDVTALTWIGICMAFYATVAVAGLTVWLQWPEAHSVFESGRDRIKRELTRLYWFTVATVGSAFVSSPPGLDEDGLMPAVLWMVLLGLIAFVHSYHAGRSRRPTCPARSADDDEAA
jgi:amino acid transporter